MRDKARIPEILDLIQEIWNKDQDMRFFQLIFNLQANFSKENKNIGKVEQIEPDGFTKVGFNLFNIEDKVLTDFLVEYLKKD